MLSNNVKKCLELLKASKETKSLDEIWNIECQIFELMSTLDIDEKIDYTFVAKLLDDGTPDIRVAAAESDIQVAHAGAGREIVHLVAKETSIPVVVESNPDGPKTVKLDSPSNLHHFIVKAYPFDDFGGVTHTPKKRKHNNRKKVKRK